MNRGSETARAAELYARVQAVTAGTAYQLNRTEQGFELTVDVQQSHRRGHRSTQLWTYDVVLNPEAMTFTIEDVVHTERRGLDGRLLSSETVAGRKVTRISSRSWPARPALLLLRRRPPSDPGCRSGIGLGGTAARFHAGGPGSCHPGPVHRARHTGRMRHSIRDRFSMKPRDQTPGFALRSSKNRAADRRQYTDRCRGAAPSAASRLHAGQKRPEDLGRFKNRYGIAATVGLYVPKGAGRKMPALVVSGPLLSSSECCRGW